MSPISLEEAVTQAKAEAEREEIAGVDIQALEQAARFALSNGTFEESEEEAPALVEEFYPETEVAGATESQSEAAANKPRLVPRVTKLTDRLGAKVGQAADQTISQEAAPC